jgi:signal transduction histidine kinase
MQEGGMLVMEDPAADPRVSERLRGLIQREGIQSGIAVPIRVAGQIFGLFGIAFCGRHSPTTQEKRVVQAIAQRAGLAIQNARLFEQAQQAATTEERERLARELHDAVTQTLFSASLIAEVVPRLWERNPDEGLRRIEELRRLTRGALSEMRTLLLELRPAALIETPFNQLVKQLAETTISRSNLDVGVRIDGEATSLPAEVHIALYRIVQESLNNVGKHASARCVEIHARWHPSGVDLRVKDDGCGFVVGAGPRGRLGLGIMQERARSIGAQLRLVSAPGRGTSVNLHWRSAL